MKVILPLAVSFVLMALVLSSAASAAPARDEAGIRARLAAYAPVRLQVDLAALSGRERQALAKILAAIDAVDGIYWKQMGP